MKQSFAKQFLVFIVILLPTHFSFGQVTNSNSLLKVIIIRHAEKPDEGDNLSCQGFNRALQLRTVLYSKYKLPDYIFVPAIKPGKSTGTARMYQTIIPFAVKYNLNIDSKYAVNDANDLAAAILKKSGTLLVVWEHTNIPKIVHALGVTDSGLKWKGDDFDSIWVVTFKNGKAFLNIDKENLQPSPACN